MHARVPGVQVGMVALHELLSAQDAGHAADAALQRQPPDGLYLAWFQNVFAGALLLPPLRLRLQHLLTGRLWRDLIAQPQLLPQKRQIPAP